MSYLSTVLADNPSHWWRLADPVGSQTFFDLVGSPKAQIWVNQIFGTTGYTGPSSDGGSMYTNGFLADQRSHSVVTQIPPLTVECWGWPMGDPTAIMSLVGWSGIVLGVNSSLNPVYRATGVLTQPATSVSAEAWHQFAITVTSTQYTMYFDGASLGTVADATTSESGKVFLANGTGGSPTIWGGYLAELAIFPTALSGSQIAAHFAAADTRADVPVLGSWSGNPGTTPNPGSSADGTLLQAIYDAVHKVFPAT